MDYRYLSYKQIENEYRSSFSRPCIDGVSRGCNLCTAYCAYDEHPGFLTDKLIKQHRCLEKNCSLLIRRKNDKRQRIVIEYAPEPQEVIENMFSDYEGLKIIETHKITDNYWHVSYIAIANYDMEKIAAKIFKKYNVKIDFELLPYSFENAARIIFKEK